MAKKSAITTTEMAESMLPKIKSVGYRQLAFNKYIAYTIITQGDSVISREETEILPLYAAMDRAKIMFVNELMDQMDSEIYDLPSVKTETNE